MEMSGDLNVALYGLSLLASKILTKTCDLSKESAAQANSTPRLDGTVIFQPIL